MHHIARLALKRDEAADDRVARIGVKDAKGQILQLLTHPLHPHAAGKGGENLHRLAGLLGLLLRLHALDRAHVVQAVGQLDEDHPQVLGHGHEQLAEILSLFRLGRGELKIGQLCHTVDQFGHFGTELLRDFGIGRLGVFDGVVQQGCHNRRIVQPLFGQDGGDGDGMGEIRLTRLAQLPVVHLLAIGIGPADQIVIRARVVVADEGDQVFDVDHPRPILPGTWAGLSSGPALPSARAEAFPRTCRRTSGGRPRCP